MEVSNLHIQVMHTEGRRGTSKASSTRDAMMSLNPIVLVTAVTDPFTCDNAIEIVRGNYFVADASDNPCTQYLINDACILEGREPKTAAMTNGRGGVQSR